MEDGKLVHHRCGSSLWSFVLTELEGSVVVEYRVWVGTAFSLPLYFCPTCGKRLKIWWERVEEVAAGVDGG